MNVFRRDQKGFRACAKSCLRTRVRPGDDSGYATVAAAGILVAVVMVVSLVLGIVALIGDSRRAANAANLAAVAAAYSEYLGRDGCAAAQRIAEANNTKLSSCRVVGRDVTVTVVIHGRTARATAGPT